MNMLNGQSNRANIEHIISEVNGEITARQTAQQALQTAQTDSELTSSIVFVKMAQSGAIDAVTAAEHIDLFSTWHENVSYAVGDLIKYDGVLYRCLQAHTSISTWQPDVSASLWTQHYVQDGDYPAWAQPIGAHDAYMHGDRVTHNGTTYESNCDNNVWEPGVYGWYDISVFDIP